MLNIIHNQYRADRWHSLMHEINRQSLGGTYRIWPALFDSPICKGVSRAHKQIVRTAKEHGWKEAIIAEDDIKFPAKDGFKYFLSKKPQHFDLYLGGIYRGEIKDGKTTDFSGLHLYIISEKFYDTFLSTDETKHLDTELAGKGDYHVCYPFAAIQYSGYSDVERDKTNFEGLLKGKLIYVGKEESTESLNPIYDEMPYRFAVDASAKYIERDNPFINAARGRDKCGINLDEAKNCK